MHVLFLNRTSDIVGGDTLSGFTIPGLWAAADIEVIVKHGIVCMVRDGFNSKHVIEEHKILSNNSSSITIIDEQINNDVSSTVMRKLLRESGTIKYLTPDSVVNYLTENLIYNDHSENHVSFRYYSTVHANYIFRTRIWS